VHQLGKAPDAFRTISEVAEDLDIPQHVLRFWETRFTSIKPLKRGGGRRYYRPDDVELLKGIRQLLYGQGYTIKGVQRILKEQGARVVQEVGRGGAMPVLRPEAAEQAYEAEAYPAYAEPAPSWPAQPQPEAYYARVPEPVPAPVQSSAMPSGDIDRLRGVLADLIECQRVLAGLRRG
jgi:DNA-binding transcriptional MerR regulator